LTVKLPGQRLLPIAQVDAAAGLQDVLQRLGTWLQSALPDGQDDMLPLTWSSWDLQVHGSGCSSNGFQIAVSSEHAIAVQLQPRS
jgi:hypothetical protein